MGLQERGSRVGLGEADTAAAVDKGIVGLELVARWRRPVGEELETAFLLLLRHVSGRIDDSKQHGSLPFVFRNATAQRKELSSRDLLFSSWPSQQVPLR